MPIFPVLRLFLVRSSLFSCFFFNDTATTEIYTLSLHDALPISSIRRSWESSSVGRSRRCSTLPVGRSEEHTSELQSRFDLVCRLLLEKKTPAPNRSGARPRAEYERARRPAGSVHACQCHSTVYKFPATRKPRPL